MISRVGLVTAVTMLGVAWGAEDWPMHLHDAGRSGFTDVPIELPLTQHWSHVSHSAPEAAWAPPIPRTVEGILEVNRLDFDLAYQVAASGEAVYFGSSSDDQVRCLDLQSGKVRWTFFADGPVRFGPSLHNGKVYFGSDDGIVYCLDAKSGAVTWKHLLGFDRTRHLGNGRLISRWPVRSGVLIEEGIAYCGAGVFPHEGVILAALNAETGAVIWKNDTLGEQDSNRSRLTPQGYLLANDKYLYVPSGRDLPAAFHRKDGKMRWHARASWRADGVVGGTYGVLIEDQLITGANQNVVFNAETGKSGIGWFHGRKIVARGEIAYFATTEWIAAVDRKKYAAGSIKLHKMRQRHDGRGGDDPIVLEAGARRELRAEQGKDPGVRSEKRIDEIKKRIVKEAQRLKTMLAEEEEHEASLKAVHWKTPVEAYSSLVATRDVVFGGGDEFVVGLDARSGVELWRAKIHGRAAGLAIAGGKLLVSSDSGRIYCFGSGAAPADAEVPREPAKFVAGTPEQRAGIAAVVKAAREKLPPGEGYALVVGLETGELAWQLAQKGDLKVIAIDPDAEVVARVRRALAPTGLYGSRIHVLHGATNQLPNYFANVVVSESALFSGTVPYEPEEIASKVRPLGGTVMIGQPAGIRAGKIMSVDAVKKWLKRLQLGELSLAEGGAPWGSVSRAALDGAGSWTHQYGTSGNTGFSEEKRLTAPLGVLWYGAPGPTEMINRHSQGTPPVSLDGRMFIVGENVLLAYDAYNGSKLWETSYEGQSRYRTQSVPGNIAADKDGALLVTKDVCYRFHPETGKVLNIFQIPKEIKRASSQWNYLGIHDGIVVGSMSSSLIPGSSRSRYSKALFAYEASSGNHLWTYEGENISQMAIAVGDGRVFLVDSKMTTEQLEERLKQDRSLLASLTGKAREKAEKKIKAADRKLAVALDLRTGDRLWSKVLDFTNCTGLSKGAGELMMMYHDRALVFAGASGNGHYWKQFLAGEFKQRKLAVVNAETGDELWHKEANYRIRPLIMGEIIVAEPWAYDLRTGKQKTRKHPTTGEESPWEFLRMGHHCGHVAATENLLFFRSGSTAYYDLESDSGVSHFSGMRTGCTINMIPANGLLHIPEASAGCQCLFAIQSTVTLEPIPAHQDRAWGIFATPGPVLPVKHLHLNFGAPGDRRDDDGNLWLSYPRPRSDSRIAPLELNLDLEIEGSKPATYMRSAETRNIKGTEIPWVHSSGYEGIERLGVAVVGRNDKAGEYTLRLHFAELEDGESEPRKFDIVVQGKVMEEGFEVRTAAGGVRKAVMREFKGVEIFDWLEISLTPHPGSKRPPSVAGLEIVRTGYSKKPKPVSYRYPPNWPVGKPEIVLKAIADSRVSLKGPDRNEGGNKELLMDGGGEAMNDELYSMVYLKFDLSKVPGKPLGVKLRLQCLGPGSNDAGEVYLTAPGWEEKTITFNKQPSRGLRVAKIGRVKEKERFEGRLAYIDPEAKELSLLLRPTSTDGIRYGSRESGTPPEIVVVYDKK